MDFCAILDQYDSHVLLHRYLWAKEESPPGYLLVMLPPSLQARRRMLVGFFFVDPKFSYNFSRCVWPLRLHPPYLLPIRPMPFSLCSEAGGGWLESWIFLHWCYFSHTSRLTLPLPTDGCPLGDRLLEMHAVDTYGEFVDANEEFLKTIPAPPVAPGPWASPMPPHNPDSIDS